MTERTVSDDPSDNGRQRGAHSIRFTTEEWDVIATAARAYELEPAVLVRRVVLKSLRGHDADIKRRLAQRTELPF